MEHHLLVSLQLKPESLRVYQPVIPLHYQSINCSHGNASIWVSNFSDTLVGGTPILVIHSGC